ncbi:MAG: MFS transporter [Acutalibacteraceae bacterium]|nr:MFS transporter [Agathobacter rectalis]MEE0733893.1 MFS transporter [Acutalibacteraceae bacterium]
MKNTQIFKRDFTMVVIGQIISLFGNAILRFALPLYLLRETDSSSLFGAVTACSFIPMVIFSFLGGVIADRVNKRNIMVALDFFTAIIIVVFYFALGQIPLVPLMIVMLMLLYGISGAYQPSVQASIPLLVDYEALAKGNAIINMVSTLSNLLGPAIGGVLFGAFGLTPILVISIVCFIISAIMEIFIHIPYQKRDKGKGIFATVRNDLIESFYFVKREKPIFLSVVGILAIFNLVLSAAMIVGIPVMVVQVLGMSDADLGIAQGALGLGGLIGGLLAGTSTQKLKIRYNYIYLLICSSTALIMGISLMSAIPTSIGFWLITIMSFVTMCVSTMFTISIFTVVQQQTPIHLLGKVMATIIAVSSCFQPIGQAIYGELFENLETISWVIMVGAAIVSFGVSILSKRIFYRLEKGE